MDGPSTDDAIEKLGDLLNITSKVRTTVPITVSSVWPKNSNFIIQNFPQHLWYVRLTEFMKILFY